MPAPGNKSTGCCVVEAMLRRVRVVRPMDSGSGAKARDELAAAAAAGPRLPRCLPQPRPRVRRPLHPLMAGLRLRQLEVGPPCIERTVLLTRLGHYVSDSRAVDRRSTS